MSGGASLSGGGAGGKEETQSEELVEEDEPASMQVTALPHPQPLMLLVLVKATAWESCTLMALVLLKTALKRCGGTSLLPPKGILMHCSVSLNVTSTVKVLL